MGNRRLPAEANTRILLCRIPTRQQHLMRIRDCSTGVPELTFLTLVSATRWACTRRQHCQTMPVLCRLTTSTNANSCAFIMCFLQHLAGAQMVLARAAASDEIVHTPHIHHADTLCLDCSPARFDIHIARHGISSAPSLS